MAQFKQTDDRVEKLEKELAEVKRELERCRPQDRWPWAKTYVGQDGGRRHPLGWPQEQASRRQESLQPHSRRVIRPPISTYHTAGRHTDDLGSCSFGVELHANMYMYV